MITMAYQTLAEYNATGISGIFLYTTHTVPIFTPLLLFAVFMISLLGVYFSQQRRTGRGDFLASFSVAGYFTAILSYFMMLIPGLIDKLTLAITTTIAIVGTILLFISRE